ncbi:bifunctional 5,10-methylenetetrahydrofolate dehydrogenase/5,10-methenyltetrahydrofolate cyclohydrolase [Anaerosalibacter bizertensis]|uniref:Bifunctional protein FolD n=1 Tax=Anaerosalibacter bizertensis TaxID=932217 RepID=A0A844FGR7_9FIRM|nr:bifunctional 5,10-methylenetetrahydrofolate dehydrogenase/5,10-methenyltetrahydrofolate cyclohydrolase [Anaerosalibacter bizertensis]MBV1817895.1 bifunctional 5,10-methylenetetrahydrofolate dehydrogenase/5,10-methenyltetrahydrofolate cyclohydrolase [Bacteroidales bacterium MSK.15.36]HHV25948.1 bifunctional 5,10-methylenetetrahydrofolate dehydrogenase/5,10-methenyltetrahydrofolate cyclohydrolase [Tissierellia bacterium]MCB5559486.1 bifunctional 5,10-methylenetetrahydrofolate dehydrogenase/5,10
MANILKGKEVVKKVKESMKRDVKDLNNRGITPTLAIIRLGENPDDIAYERSILKNCDGVGIEGEVYEKDENISTEDLISLIEELNTDNNVHGILIFRPLPKHIDEDIIAKTISPLKDVDCMNPLNLEKIFEGNMEGFAPCTPKAAVMIMDHYNIPLEGAHVVIINRSMVVGRPLSMMLLGKNSTVTICHSKTKDLKGFTNSADVVVTALGRPKYVTDEYFNEKSVVIDVGISFDENGKMAGDVDFDNVSSKVEAITPVPGGVGSLTTSILLSHVILAAKSL